MPLLEDNTEAGSCLEMHERQRRQHKQRNMGYVERNGKETSSEQIEGRGDVNENGRQGRRSQSMIRSDWHGAQNGSQDGGKGFGNNFIKTHIP